MEIIRTEGYWEEFTSHPEFLESILGSIISQNRHKSYSTAIFPHLSMVGEIAEAIGHSVVFARSQNLNLSRVENNALFWVHCRFDELGEDEVVLLGEKISLGKKGEIERSFSDSLRRGDYYVSPDGKKWLVAGGRGDHYRTASMWFEFVNDEEFEQARELKKREWAELEERARAEAEEKEREDLRYRSSIRGLTEGLNLSILTRVNTAAAMPAPFMVCRYERENDSLDQRFLVVASFCSLNGCYAFLRNIVKYVRQTNGGHITIEAWRNLDRDAAVKFALDECEKHADRLRESESAC